MAEHPVADTVTVLIFGSLRGYLDKQGLPFTLEHAVPPGGRPGTRIAEDLHIPPEKVEAVFRNGQVVNIHDPVFPGDRVALFPHGTPGPYRLFLGMLRENVERTKRERTRGETDPA